MVASPNGKEHETHPIPGSTGHNAAQDGFQIIHFEIAVTLGQQRTDFFRRHADDRRIGICEVTPDLKGCPPWGKAFVFRFVKVRTIAAVFEQFDQGIEIRDFEHSGQFLLADQRGIHGTYPRINGSIF